MTHFPVGNDFFCMHIKISQRYPVACGRDLIGGKEGNYNRGLYTTQRRGEREGGKDRFLENKRMSICLFVSSCSVSAAWEWHA